VIDQPVSTGFLNGVVPPESPLKRAEMENDGEDGGDPVNQA